MDNTEFLSRLKDPKTYGPKVTEVSLLQTHISIIALTDRYVYKIKKPVNFGFLDFSTLEKRKHFCYEEIRLNSRLCPEIYRDIVSITFDSSQGLRVNGKGDIIEYAVEMEKFSQDRIMTHLLKEKKVSKHHIESICKILVDFYHRVDPSNDIREYGTLESVKKNIDENFFQTKDVVDVTISKYDYHFIKDACDLFFKKQKDVFLKRIDQDMIKECHGDLHSGNIVIGDTDDICIFDCIEFNKRFRYIDVASDIGFLAMDLDFNNNFYLSSYLIQTYIEQSKDLDILDVLQFYKSYRAYVRGKVLGFQLNDVHITDETRNDIIRTARSYYDLSLYYASLFQLQCSRKHPYIFLVSGLTGTGKSTLALKLSIDYHAQIINTDIVRKQVAGIDTFERHHDEPNTGLYDPRNVENTYEQVLALARSFLSEHKSIVLDATFQKKIHRDMVRELAREHNATLIPILCICPDEVARSWLMQRLHEKTASDGRWEIYQTMKKTFEPYDASEDHIEFDTSEETYEKQREQYTSILSFIQDR
ncbi:MAG: AAA family ATPase [Candidatus Thermoplasmatota archaeon]|nr:AAA family ATPase [Candidatus Thermoplasmatota archaeon]